MHKSSSPAMDASVYAFAFIQGQLAEYQLTTETSGENAWGLPNLLDEKLARVKKTPKWLVDCGIQFGLPLCFIIVLFLVSYGLVLLGPLKGISGPPPGMRYAEDDELGGGADGAYDEDGDL